MFRYFQVVSENLKQLESTETLITNTLYLTIKMET